MSSAAGGDVWTTSRSSRATESAGEPRLGGRGKGQGAMVRGEGVRWSNLRVDGLGASGRVTGQGARMTQAGAAGVLWLRAGERSFKHNIL
jgi:hypothetical protein